MNRNLIKRKGLLIIGLILILSLSGCGKDSDKEVKKEEEIEEIDDIAEEREEDSEEIVEEIIVDNFFAELDTLNLDGENIGPEIFKENKLTLINAWATWCGPCVAEIEDLAKIAKEYEGTGELGIKGLLIETEGTEINIGVSDEERELAEDILEKSNADYEQLLISEQLLDTQIANIMAFPTSYFVDSEGNFVGEAIEGMMYKEQWEQVIEDRLQMLEDE